MKLTSFITDHMDEILSEWEAFARTLEPALNPDTEFLGAVHLRLLPALLSRLGDKVDRGRVPVVQGSAA